MKNHQILFLLPAALLMLFVSPTITNAQHAETLLSGEVGHGGFGGPVVKIGNVAGSTGAWVGGRGGWIILPDGNHSISLGIGGYGLVTEHESPTNSDLYALNGYGGFELEYTNRSARIVHFTFTTLLGGGGLMLRERHFEDANHDVDNYFVFEPGAHAELNVTNFFRISAGTSYRMTSGISRFGFSDSDFSGLNGVITLKFGKFL